MANTHTSTTTPLDPETTIQHLGGHRALHLMIAAHSYVTGDDSLTFQFKGSRKTNRVRITLNTSDLYNLEFYAGRGVNTRKVAEVNDVFCENLRDTFEQQTGLALRVPRLLGA